MSEAKHTPRPWRVGVPIAGKINVSHLDCTPGVITQNLCWVAARPTWVEEGKANARLIAAAPDLLDALLYARRFLKPKEVDMAFIDAAIAKATGEQA